MATTLLPDLAARMEFVDARYHEDYEAVRVRSVEGGSQFLFIGVHLSTFELSYAIQCRPHPRMIFLVGEVDYVSGLVPYSLDGQGREVLAIRLRLPTGATCEVSHVYEKQRARLRDIMVDDDREIGGETAQSWFDGSGIESTWTEAPHCFYVFVRNLLGHRTRTAAALQPGSLITVSGSMERIDMDKTDGIARHYYFWVRNFRVLNETFSRKGSDYVCDRSPGDGCEYYDPKTTNAVFDWSSLPRACALGLHTKHSPPTCRALVCVSGVLQLVASPGTFAPQASFSPHALLPLMRISPEQPTPSLSRMPAAVHLQRSAENLF
ncbi:hypothetical protein DFH06DRAFT_1477332 [Mycena polygramma]|nr:hypothetical protein DFH06DRAFT_1477332 [Mycena polygramma]